MSVEFRIGGRVVCIQGAPFRPYNAWETPTHERAIYTVREFYVNRQGEVGLRFEEIINPPLSYGGGTEVSYSRRRFRPVRETSIDCFTALLAKPPVRLRGDA